MPRLLLIAAALAIPAAAAALATPAAAAANGVATGSTDAGALAAPYEAPVYQPDPTLSVGVGLSTFGITVTPQARITDHVGIRAPIGFFRLEDTFDVEGNDIDGSATSAQGALLLDYYPGGGGFRVSAGLGIGGYVVDARGTSLTVTDTATDTDYTINADYGATVEQESGIAPMLAIGFTSPRERRTQLSFDIGVKYVSYGLTLDTANLELDPNYDPTDIDALVADFEKEADNYPFTPYVHFSLAIRF